jgi:tryptophan-rich sensory protein
MKFKMNYIVIPLITILTAAVGSWLTSKGMGWYQTIKLPPWTPPGSAIGSVWTTIFILSAVSALIVWNKAPRDARFCWIIAIFIANAILNVFWSFLFFNQHLFGQAVIEAAVLGISVAALVVLIWPVSRLASLLLAPYFAWVTFATYLAYVIWTIN